MTTALLAYDEPHMREVLRKQLQLLWPELKVIGWAPDGPSAMLQIESLRPDIAFLNIRMPGMTGLQVARAVTVQARIAFATAFDSHALEAVEGHDTACSGDGEAVSDAALGGPPKPYVRCTSHRRHTDQHQ
jgi:DNA-binding LytR/AlgR family response regulator